MKKTLFLFISLAVFVVYSAQGQSTVPNNSMETWINNPGPPSYDDPAGWSTLNPTSNAFFGNNPVSVFKTADKHSGTYAARIKTIVMTTNPAPGDIPDTVGIMFTGSFDLSGIKFGYPFTSKPAKLKFYCKYSPAGIDTAYVYVNLTKWNVTSSSRDTLAEGIFRINDTTSTYILNEVLLNYDTTSLALAPDTATIIVSSSGNVNPKKNSEFFIDDFEFTGGNVGINEHKEKNKTNVFPNPAVNYTSINVSNNNAVSVQVYNITGKKMHDDSIENRTTRICTSDFPAGLYFYSISDKSKQVLNNGKFSVIK